MHPSGLPWPSSSCLPRKQLEAKVASKSLMLFKSSPLNEPSMVVGTGGRSDSKCFAALVILCGVVGGVGKMR